MQLIRNPILCRDLKAKCEIRKKNHLLILNGHFSIIFEKPGTCATGRKFSGVCIPFLNKGEILAILRRLGNFPSLNDLLMINFKGCNRKFEASSGGKIPY